MKTKKIEVLAPAGNPAALKAAVFAGADAVYMGGSLFSARASAVNFSREEMREAVLFARERNVRVYVTVNTLLKDDELPEALDFCKFLCSVPVDGILIQDMGLFNILREACPEMPLHASTQMSLHTPGGAALTLVIAAVGIVCSVPLLRAQGTEEAVCREAAVYLQLVFAGLICCFLYNYYASMLRSCGNSRTPFVILLVSSTLHALLDVLFVGVLAWGIRGVACSTVLCQAFSAAWCILYAERRCPPLTLKRSELRFERRMGGMVLSYAWAAALQQAVVCIGRLLVQGMLTPLGTNTVTGYNMSLRIEQFLFCFSQGVSAAMVVCLSQNLGHGDRVRVRRFYRVSVCVEAALIAVLGTVCFLFPSQIVGLFSDNGEVIAAGARYTGTMAYLYLFAYMGEVIQGFFRGLGRLRLTMVASLLQVVLRVVLSYFLIPVWGMYGICVAVASGWVLLVLIEGSYSVRTARALTMEKREE